MASTSRLARPAADSYVAIVRSNEGAINRDPDLTGSDKRVGRYLCTCALGDDGKRLRYCHPLQSQVAADLRLSARAVKYAVAKLKKYFRVKRGFKKRLADGSWYAKANQYHPLTQQARTAPETSTGKHPAATTTITASIPPSLPEPAYLTCREADASRDQLVADMLYNGWDDTIEEFPAILTMPADQLRALRRAVDDMRDAIPEGADDGPDYAGAVEIALMEP